MEVCGVCNSSRANIFGFAVGAALGRQQLSGDRLIILTPFVGKKPNFPSDIISPASIPRASGKKQLLKGAEASEPHVKNWPAAWLAGFGSCAHTNHVTC
jgi:hypothetical protein